MRVLRLKCMFCTGTLMNASFSKSELFSYLTCQICQKRQMCFKEDFNNHIKVTHDKGLKEFMDNE